MLIHLDSSAVADAVGSGPTSKKSLDCVDVLLRAHHEGNHLISMDPEDAERFVPVLPRLSEVARNVLDRLRATALEIQGLRDQLTWHMELGLGDAFDANIYPRAEGGSVIRALLHHFNRSKRVDAALLLCEGPNDAPFYASLGRLVLALRRWGNLRLQAEARGAGGSTFAPEFLVAADRGRIILAIADSDRGSPKGATGSTWSGLRKAAEGRPGFQRARVLHVREAENLVPLKAYKAVFEHHGDRAVQLSSLSLLKPLSELEIRHADLKDGITLYQIDHVMKPGSGEHDLWSRLRDRLKPTVCWRPGGNECIERKECECYVVERLGDKILDDVVRWLDDESDQRPRHIAGLMGLPGDEALAGLCDEVIAFSCAYPEMVT